MQKIWFKARLYGWGWYPSTWQGFAITVLFIIALVANNMLLKDYGLTLLINIILIILLFYICYKTGEKPRWRWGK